MHAPNIGGQWAGHLVSPCINSPALIRLKPSPKSPGWESNYRHGMCPIHVSSNHIILPPLEVYRSQGSHIGPQLPVPDYHAFSHQIFAGMACAEHRTSRAVGSRIGRIPIPFASLSWQAKAEMLVAMRNLVS